jgi:hypothetical protein
MSTPFLFKNLWSDYYQSSLAGITTAEIGCQPVWDASGAPIDSKPVFGMAYAFNNLAQSALLAVPKQQLHTFRYISSQHPSDGAFPPLLGTNFRLRTQNGDSNITY